MKQSIDQLSLRSRVVGGALGLCLATALGLSGALAQDEATPTAESTPAAETAPANEETPPPPEFDLSAAERTQLAEQIHAVTETIAAVQADRDAVGTTADVTKVDALLTQATALRDAAQAALDGDDPSTAPSQLFAAQATAHAAWQLLQAHLADYGLPSQQAGVSRILVSAYNQIKELTDTLESAEDVSADATFYVTTAQELYAAAYDLYNAGTYAQAAGTAETAVSLGHIGLMLAKGGWIAEAGVSAGGGGTFSVEGHADDVFSGEMHGAGAGGFSVAEAPDGVHAGEARGGAHGVTEPGIVTVERPGDVRVERIDPAAESGKVHGGGFVELVPSVGAVPAVEVHGGFFSPWGAIGGIGSSDDTPLDVPAPEF